MKISLNGWMLKVEKEEGDPHYKQGGYAGNCAAESRLLYHVKQKLQALGLDVIKKRVQADGHMFGDEMSQYIRTRSPNSSEPHFYIYNDAWAIYDAGEKFNKDGVVQFDMMFDVYNMNPSTEAAAKHRDMLRAILEKGATNE